MALMNYKFDFRLGILNLDPAREQYELNNIFRLRLQLLHIFT